MGRTVGSGEDFGKELKVGNCIPIGKCKSVFFLRNVTGLKDWIGFSV